MVCSVFSINLYLFLFSAFFYRYIGVTNRSCDQQDLNLYCVCLAHMFWLYEYIEEALLIMSLAKSIHAYKTQILKIVVCWIFGITDIFSPISERFYWNFSCFSFCLFVFCLKKKIFYLHQPPIHHAGLDVGYLIRQEVAKAIGYKTTLETRFIHGERYSTLSDRLYHLGRLGRKTGKWKKNFCFNGTKVSSGVKVSFCSGYLSCDWALCQSQLSVPRGLGLFIHIHKKKTLKLNILKR